MNKLPAHVAEAYAAREDAQRRHADTQRGLEILSEEKASAVDLLERATENYHDALLKRHLGWGDDPDAVEDARGYFNDAQRRLDELEIIGPALEKEAAKWEARALNGMHNVTIARYEREQREAL